ncbi:hypothetical protein CHGG_08284 [Chaetomium globosum CBS 148.51]|uniref:Ribosomal protein S19 n=1 Tax=Chaetomium globosum (strain ATCC 6205 / CBS 148.51 / DSM 1962 / NBRC 6347 / NRRL 1970) TaxID=306901 RepID=Q2GUS0_CHAGB|nr:mitochondrial 37S ribosomal protein RSM19 [Chaetomium globosum CBS 148.51]EAQ87031.1 hypothetical protein CHGG_08284 [Chaetomium globosum CBS 148.51]
MQPTRCLLKRSDRTSFRKSTLLISAGIIPPNKPTTSCSQYFSAPHRRPATRLPRRSNHLPLPRLPIVRPEPGKRVAPIRTQARSATILPNFVGLKFQVHNGKVYHDVTITEEMVGHKLGEFSPPLYGTGNKATPYDGKSQGVLTLRTLAFAA